MNCDGFAEGFEAGYQVFIVSVDFLEDMFRACAETVVWYSHVVGGYDEGDGVVHRRCCNMGRR